MSHCIECSSKIEKIEQVLEALIDYQEVIMTELEVEAIAQSALEAAVAAEAAELAKLSAELKAQALANQQVLPPGALLSIATALDSMTARLTASTAAAVVADPVVEGSAVEEATETPAAEVIEDAPTPAV